MLNLYHLKYFVDSANLKSLTKASELNLVGPSAISQSIRQLEESLGCKLIKHNKNRFSLTAEGRALQEKGAKILESVKLMQSEIKHSDEEGVGPLSIATTHSLAQCIVLPALNTVYKTFPNLNPKVKIGGTHSVIEKVEAKEADLGIAMDDGSTTSLKKMVISRGQFKIFANKDLQRKLWHQQKIWHTNPDFEGRGIESQFLKRFKKSPDWGFQLESWGLVAKMVEDGMGVGILPDFISQTHPHLTSVNATIDLRKYVLNVYFRRGEELNSNSRIFMQAMNQIKFKST